MTRRVVDLATVRRVRAELAELVKQHPELTSPEAQARLAGALPEIERMSNKLDPNATGAATTVGVRLSPELLAVVDAEVERLRAMVPGSSIGRSDAVRALLLRAAGLDAATAPKATAPKRRTAKR